jgi:hypothetical protein
MGPLVDVISGVNIKNTTSVKRPSDLVVFICSCALVEVFGGKGAAVRHFAHVYYQSLLEDLGVARVFHFEVFDGVVIQVDLDKVIWYSNYAEIVMRGFNRSQIPADADYTQIFNDHTAREKGNKKVRGVWRGKSVPRSDYSNAQSVCKNGLWPFGLQRC